MRYSLFSRSPLYPVHSWTVQGTLALAGLIFSSLCHAQQQLPELPFNPQDGETVVFLGDSITHQSLYTQYLEDFFITRYPERKIRFHNAGVGGDRVGDCLARFDQDVAELDPDYVFVLLGMNDGNYEDFSNETIKTYQSGMSLLLDRIAETEAKAIVLSPTMFDHGTAKRRADDENWRFRTKAFSSNYNALMAWLGAWAMEESGRRSLPFVNLWGPLNEHTIAERRKAPNFTMIDDAIHPQASGQMVMAFEILSQLGVERRGANSITISKRGSNWIGKELKNLTVNDAQTEVSFSHTAASLPWVIPIEEATKPLRWQLPSDGRLGYSLTKAGHKISSDRLKISGLTPGNYEVLINDEVIGKWNHIALGTKIEIQENEKTPQFQQALKVAHLNQKRNDDVVRDLRGIWSKIKAARNAEPTTRKPNELPELFQKAEDLTLEEAASLDAIYAAAKPFEQQWVIRRCD